MHYDTTLLRQFRRSIGGNIHRLRAERRVPLRRLSRLTGIAEERLDHYELGKEEIGTEALLRIACGLGVEIGALMETGRPSP